MKRGGLSSSSSSSSSPPPPSFLFLLLLSLLFFPFNNAKQECFPYIFDNECSQFFEEKEGVGGGVLVGGERVQEEVWEEIALSISNVRMMERSCRRPLVFYLCLEAFGGCGYASFVFFFFFFFFFFCFVFGVQNFSLFLSPFPPLFSPPPLTSLPSS